MKREFLVFGIVESVEPNGNVIRRHFKQGGIMAIDGFSAVCEYRRLHSVDANGSALTYPEIDAIML